MRKGPLILIAVSAALLAAVGMWWTAPSVAIPAIPAIPMAMAPRSAPTPPPKPRAAVPVSKAVIVATPIAQLPAEPRTFHPPDPPEWVDTTEVLVGGSMPDVALGLREHEHRVRDCYEQWAAVHGPVQSKLQFEVTVEAGAQGDVVQPKATNVWAVDEVESLEACTNEALADLRFAAPEHAQTLIWQVP